jgi:hypothetical protein
MFFSDVFANRPTAAIVGRIFVSTDTYELYRDTGTTWDLLSGPGTGTITGSGTAFKYPVFTASGVIGNGTIEQFTTTNKSTKNFVIDNGGNESSLLINGIQDAFIYFGENSVNQWRIGNNDVTGEGAHNFQLFDVTNNIARLSATIGGNMQFNTESISIISNDNNALLIFATEPNLTISATGVSNSAKITLTPSSGAFSGIIRTGYATNSLQFQTGANITRLEIGATGTISFFGNLNTTLNQNAATGLTISNSTSGTAANSFIKLQTTNASTFGEIAKVSSGFTPIKIIAANDLGIYNSTGSGDIAILNDFATGNIKFAAGGSSSTQMILDSNGRLGIGTTTPAYPLNIVKGVGSGSLDVVFQTLDTTAVNTFYLDNNLGRGFRLSSYGSAASGTLLDGTINRAGSSVIRTNETSNNIVIGGLSTSAQYIYFGQNNISIAINNATQSVSIGTGTFVGFKLDVSGTTRFNGNCTVVGDLTTSGNYVRSGVFESTRFETAANWGITLTNNNSGGVNILQPSLTTNNPIGNVNGLQLSYRFGGATSTFTNNTILIANTINQTTGTGITRGIYINPTLTLAADWRAIEISSGGVYVNTSSVSASAILQADSTTKGFLPPRMTSVERNAIGTLVAGLMVYDTTTNKLYVYTNAWEQITSI